LHGQSAYAIIIIRGKRGEYKGIFESALKFLMRIEDKKDLVDKRKKIV
jgi:hypothetical protein